MRLPRKTKKGLKRGYVAVTCALAADLGRKRHGVELTRAQLRRGMRASFKRKPGSLTVLDKLTGESVTVYLQARCRS